jgi:hypothetical protein
MTELTRILSAIGQGEPQAARHLAGEKPGQTLDATALVHEAYLRLVGNQPDRRWDGTSLRSRCAHR